jgi:hypothetical protein
LCGRGWAALSDHDLPGRLSSIVLSTAIERYTVSIAAACSGVMRSSAVVAVSAWMVSTRFMGRLGYGSLEVVGIVAQAAHALEPSTRSARSRVRGLRAGGTRSLSCS